MVMTATGYDQHEAHCTFNKIEETKPGAWRVTSTCTVEGSEENGDMSFSVDGDTLSLGEGEDVFKLTRGTK